MNDIPEHLRQFFITESSELSRININFYMNVDVETATRHLAKPNSPLDYGKPSDGAHILYPKNDALDGFFLLCEPDSENLEEPEHVEAAKLLGIQPRSELHYGRCSVNKDKMIAMRDIMEYIGRGKITHHVSVQSDDTGESLSKIPFYMFIINNDSGNPIYGIGYAGDKKLTMAKEIPKGLDLLVANRV